MAQAKTTTAPAVYTPKTLSVLVSATIGRTVSPKQVRGRVRGDSGAPLLARYGAAEKSADYASHVYTATEADLIGSALVAASNARTGQSKVWRPLAAPKATRKRAARPKVAAPKVAAQTTTDASDAV